MQSIITSSLNTAKLNYEAGVKALAESNLNRFIQGTHSRMLRLRSLPARAPPSIQSIPYIQNDPFQIIYDGLSTEMTGTFKFHLDNKYAQDVSDSNNNHIEYESLNGASQLSVSAGKPTLPAIHAALGPLAYDVFGFPTHRPLTRSLPDDCFMPGPKTILAPPDRIISRPTSQIGWNVNALGLSPSPAEFLDSAIPSVKSTIEFILNDDDEESARTTASDPTNSLPELSPLFKTLDEASGGSDSETDTPLNTPPTIHLPSIESFIYACAHIEAEEILNGTSDSFFGKPFNWVKEGMLPPPINTRFSGSFANAST